MSGYRQFCGLAVALDVVGDRWNLLIIRELLIAPRRFSQLRAALPGAASNLLTERLRTLEDRGLLTRSHDPNRKAVEYSLTPTGGGLRESVHALVRWGAQFMAAGPADGDLVRGEWIQLAAEALLPNATVDAVEPKLDQEGRVALTIRADDVDAAVVQITGAPAVVLGTLAAAIPIERVHAFGVDIEDRDGALRSLLPAAK